MAYATDFRSGHHGLISDRVHAVMANFRKAREQRKAYRQTYDELTDLSPRELDDLGICSGQIPFIAREAANLVK